jgi:DnaJ-class molecular chaperone
MRSEDREIIICSNCKGKGYYQESKLTNYHHNEYDYWDETCPMCNGKGRMLKTTLINIDKLEDK